MFTGRYGLDLYIQFRLVLAVQELTTGQCISQSYGVRCCATGRVPRDVSKNHNAFISSSCLTHKRKTLRSFETSRIIRPLTQYHIPRDWNLT